MDLGVPELLIVLLVALVVFGGSQIPKLARGLGSAHREFNKGLQGVDDEPKPAATDAVPDKELPPPAAPEGRQFS